MPFYSAEFVMIEENLWFAPGTSNAVRRTEKRLLHILVFTAANPDEAFERAEGMISGFSNTDHNGDGDQRNYSSIGLHELENVLLGDGASIFEEAANDSYGVHIAAVAFDSDSFTVRAKEDLQAFRERSFSPK